MGWAYAAVVVVGAVGVRLLVKRKHPDTVEERARGLDVEGTAPWDRWLAPIVVFSPMAAVLVAGLDVRFGWSTVAGTPLQIAAVSGSAAFLTLPLRGRMFAASEL